MEFRLNFNKYFNFVMAKLHIKMMDAILKYKYLQSGAPEDQQNATMLLLFVRALQQNATIHQQPAPTTDKITRTTTETARSTSSSSRQTKTGSNAFNLKKNYFHNSENELSATNQSMVSFLPHNNPEPPSGSSNHHSNPSNRPD